MVLVEKKVIELWGQPVANSAVLVSADGKARGLLIETDAGLRFRAAGETASRFELEWPSITGVRASLVAPRRLAVSTAGEHHRLRFTDAVIDASLSEDGPDGSGDDDSPLESRLVPPDAMREEVLLDDVGTAVGAVSVVVGYFAADRVRRGRVMNRILARAGLE